MTTILGHKIGPVGFGTMGLTRPTHDVTQEDAFIALDAAFACGANYWNGGEFYGTTDRNTCHLLNAYFTKHPKRAEKILLAIKGGRMPDTGVFDGSETSIRRSVDECIRVLDGKKKLDIFECARVDPNTPIEESMRVLAQLVREGKIRGIGLSEVQADTIKRAVKVHPVVQVEVELSLWSTDILHNGVAATCAELGIPIIAYAPLSRGGLTASLPLKTSDLPEHLRRFPRFQNDETLLLNRQFTLEVEEVAREKGCSVPQLALNWIRGLSGKNSLGVIIPIPGAERPDWVADNCKKIPLTSDEMQRLADIRAKMPVKGGRYHEKEAKYSEC